MIAAIYARKSTDQNLPDAEKSVARQIAHATAYAAKKGWTVHDDHVYQDDGISGAEFGDKKRPGLMRLLNALRPRPPFQVLLITDRDRIGREQIETSYILKQLLRAGVQVIECKGADGHPITLTSATDKVILAVEDFAAEVEREKARTRTYDAMERKAKAGHVTGGRVYGYDNVPVFGETPGPDGRPRRVCVVRRVHLEEARVIRRLFEGFVSGRGLTRLAKSLNGDHVPPPRGHGRGWAPTAIREILRRELYRGVIVWNQTRKRDAWGAKSPTRRPSSEWVRVDAPDLRIIPEDLWRAAAARRTRAAQTFVRDPAGAERDAQGKPRGGRLRGRPSVEDFESPYLLSGLARCAPCGGALVGLTRTHGRGRRALYGCAFHHKRGAAICANGLQIRQDRLEGAFLAALAAVLDARMIEDAVRDALTRLRQDDAGRGDRRATLVRERSLVEARVQHLLEAVKRGHATDALLQELEREDARKTALATELDHLAQMRVTSLDAAQMSRTLTALAADVQTVLAGAPGQARQMLRRLFTGHRITCAPFVDPDGTRGYTFEAEGTYAALLAGRVVNDGGVPDGIRTRVSRLKIWGPRPA